MCTLGTGNVDNFTRPRPAVEPQPTTWGADRHQKPLVPVSQSVQPGNTQFIDKLPGSDVSRTHPSTLQRQDTPLWPPGQENTPGRLGLYTYDILRKLSLYTLLGDRQQLCSYKTLCLYRLVQWTHHCLCTTLPAPRWTFSNGKLYHPVRSVIDFLHRLFPHICLMPPAPKSSLCRYMLDRLTTSTRLCLSVRIHAYQLIMTPACVCTLTAAAWNSGLRRRWYSSEV